MIGLLNPARYVLVSPMNPELATITAKGQVTIPKAMQFGNQTTGNSLVPIPLNLINLLITT